MPASQEGGAVLRQETAAGTYTSPVIRTQCAQKSPLFAGMAYDILASLHLCSGTESSRGPEGSSEGSRAPECVPLYVLSFALRTLGCRETDAMKTPYYPGIFY